MVQIYPTPNATDSEGLFELTAYVNRVADGLLFPVLMFIIFIVIFGATKRYESSTAFTYASFVCAILSIPLAVMNLIAPKFMYLFIFFTAVGIVWIKLTGNAQTF